MEVLYKRCCGIDIHKNMMVACVFTGVRKKEVRQFSTMTEDILQLVSWLKETDCEMAAMESTDSYWKPVYNIFEEEHIPIMIVNAQHIKGVPGRKTDVKDAEWIADTSWVSKSKLYPKSGTARIARNDPLPPGDD